MKFVDYELRMNIILEMLLLSYFLNDETKMKDISLKYISRGYPAEQLHILEVAAKNIYKITDLI